MNLRTPVFFGALVLVLAGPAMADSRLEFDGFDDRVTIPYDSSFPTRVFTISAWIKLSPPARRAAIIARGEDDNSFNLSWQLYVHPDGALEIMLEDDREENFCYPRTCMGQPQLSCVAGDLFVADDVWHHVAATRTAAGALTLYVDGQSRMTCPGTGVPSANNFQDLTIGCTHGSIGPLPPGGTEPPIWFFPGLIDEPAMWSIPLGGAQIQDLYANGVNPNSSGLAGYWDFEEGTGQLIADGSPAGNNGFLGFSDGADGADPSWVGDSPPPPPPPPTIPAAPSNLSATASSVSTIDLEWTDNSATEERFAIDRRQIGGLFSPIATVPANVTAFTDTGLPVASSFEYRVAASNAAGDSQPSNVAGATTLAPTDCTDNAETLCLNQERFQVEVEWRNFQGGTGPGLVVLSSEDSGLFWFFHPDNWEMMVKVLDACGFNDRFWVFAAATTNVEYTLRVTDSQTGVTKEYFNPLGVSAAAITDTNAFATCP